MGGPTGESSMRGRRIVGAAVAGVLVLPLLVGSAFAGSTLSRTDQPAVLTGAQIANMKGIPPGDLVGFRYGASGWTQIPIQVDEVKVFNIRKAYPAVMPNCPTSGSGLCFGPANRVWWERVYADPNTLTGPEIDETVSVTSGPLCAGLADGNLGNVPLTCTLSNSSMFDGDDEVALMVKDAGGQAPSGVADPAGVLQEHIEVSLRDTLDNGTGYVYIFQRDPNLAQPLEPSAGTSYVTYDWVVNHIQANHPADPNATENFFRSEYRFTGQGGAGNPESSVVETAHYRREMAGRWTDNVLVNKRGADAPVNILDRHDASITTDNVSACTRYQGTFDGGEMTYLTSKGGAIRVIRAYLGTNSGPFVERRQIFYESSEWEHIELRVHPVPGPTEVWNLNANATGMRYSTLVGSDRVDHLGVAPGGFAGVPGSGNTAGTYVGGPAIPPKTWHWQALDRDTASDPSRGGLTFTVFFDTNNPDPVAHSLYRDSGNGGCKGGNSSGTPYYGAILDQAPAVMSDTDANWGSLITGGTTGLLGTQQTFLTIKRTLHYEQTGGANGPRRQAEDSTPLGVTASNR